MAKFTDTFNPEDAKKQVKTNVEAAGAMIECIVQMAASVAYKAAELKSAEHDELNKTQELTAFLEAMQKTDFLLKNLMVTNYELGQALYDSNRKLEELTALEKSDNIINVDEGTKAFFGDLMKRVSKGE